MVLAESKGERDLEDGLRAVLAAIDSKRHAITSRNQLALRLGLTRQAISGWSKVPVEHVLEIESLLGVSRYRIRPDIYGKPPKT